MILRKKLILKSRFLKKFCSQKSLFDSIYPVKCAYFALYVQFQKARFWWKIFSKNDGFEFEILSTKHDFEWKSFCEKLGLELKIFRLVRFRINFSTTRQLLS